MNEFETIPFAQRQRLHYVETLALWEGSVQIRRVCQSFAVSTSQATRDLGTYIDQCPDNLVYNKRLKVYRPSTAFSPVLATGDPREYLSFLGTDIHCRTVAFLPGLQIAQVPYAALSAPRVSIDSHALRQILIAVQRKLALDVRYFSMSSAGASSRTIWPHALFFSADWWYVRAFDSRCNSFRDFALHRIQQADASIAACHTDAKSDKHWHDTIEFSLIPDPRLSAIQQNIVALDYGMVRESYGWVWKETVRQCMVRYFVAHHWPDMNIDQPSRRCLSLRNREEVEPFVFRSVLEADD